MVFSSRAHGADRKKMRYVVPAIVSEYQTPSVNLEKISSIIISNKRVEISPGDMVSQKSATSKKFPKISNDFRCNVINHLSSPPITSNPGTRAAVSLTVLSPQSCLTDLLKRDVVDNNRFSKPSRSRFDSGCRQFLFALL